MRPWVRAVVVSAVAFGIIACDSSTDPDDAPRVEYLAVAGAPTPPVGTVALCYTGPDGGTLDSLCPVIKWNDITYWVLAYDDNRNALSLVAYDDDDNVLSQSEKIGTTQLYEITINNNRRTIVLHGLGAATAIVHWVELEVD